jgi:hypothetical protein
VTGSWPTRGRFRKGADRTTGGATAAYVWPEQDPSPVEEPGFVTAPQVKAGEFRLHQVACPGSGRPPKQRSGRSRDLGTMSVPGRILTAMQITEHALERAWHTIAAGSDLLDDVMFPRTGTSPDQYAPPAGAGDGLFLVVGEDGTVRGYINPYREVFATQDLDEVMYFAAEDAVRRLAEHIVSRSPGQGPVANLVAGQAQLLDRIDAAWGRRFRDGGTPASNERPQAAQPCGRDPLERLAWIAPSWRDQQPYTHLTFFRGKDLDGEDVSAEEIALLHGADPAQVAAGTRLSDLCGTDLGWGDAWDIMWKTCCFGQAGDWSFLLYHDMPGAPLGSAALSRIGVTETVRLNATMAKAIYTFDYMRDDRRVDDDWGVLELIWYKRGRAPYYRGGELDLLNRSIRRAELDHPEVTDEFELYFHALDDALGLQLPRREIEEGTVRAARWAPAELGAGPVVKGRHKKS